MTASRTRVGTELRRELRLAEPHLRSELAHIDLWDVHQRHAHVVVLAARRRNRLFQSFAAIFSLIFDIPP
jgi:hypothetical protein